MTSAPAYRTGRQAKDPMPTNKRLSPLWMGFLPLGRQASIPAYRQAGLPAEGGPAYRRVKDPSAFQQ